MALHYREGDQHQGVEPPSPPNQEVEAAIPAPATEECPVCSVNTNSMTNAQAADHWWNHVQELHALLAERTQKLEAAEAVARIAVAADEVRRQAVIRLTRERDEAREDRDRLFIRLETGHKRSHPDHFDGLRPVDCPSCIVLGSVFCRGPPRPVERREGKSMIVVYGPRGGRTPVEPMVAPAGNLYWYRLYVPWWSRGLTEGEDLMLQKVGTRNEIAFEVDGP